MGVERLKGSIFNPNGDPMAVEAIRLTAEQAQILRAYKKQVLDPLGLKEALYCDRCWENNLSHGMEAFVTTNKIMLKCRCAIRVFDGPTY